MAKYFTAIKSTTCPITIRSYACEQAQARIEIYPISRSFDFFGYSMRRYCHPIPIIRSIVIH